MVGVGVRVGKPLRPHLGITDDRADIAQHSGAVDSAAQRGHGRGQRVARPLPLPRARSSPDEGGELGLLAVQGVAQLMHLPRRCCHRVGVAQRRHGWDVGCAQASGHRTGDHLLGSASSRGNHGRQLSRHASQLGDVLGDHIHQLTRRGLSLHGLQRGDGSDGLGTAWTSVLRRRRRHAHKHADVLAVGSVRRGRSGGGGSRGARERRARGSQHDQRVRHGLRGFAEPRTVGAHPLLGACEGHRGRRGVLVRRCLRARGGCEPHPAVQLRELASRGSHELALLRGEQHEVLRVAGAAVHLQRRQVLVVVGGHGQPQPLQLVQAPVRVLLALWPLPAQVSSHVCRRALQQGSRVGVAACGRHGKLLTKHVQRWQRAGQLEYGRLLPLLAGDNTSTRHKASILQHLEQRAQSPLLDGLRDRGGSQRLRPLHNARRHGVQISRCPTQSRASGAAEDAGAHDAAGTRHQARQLAHEPAGGARWLAQRTQRGDGAVKLLQLCNRRGWHGHRRWLHHRRHCRAGAGGGGLLGDSVDDRLHGLRQALRVVHHHLVQGAVGLLRGLLERVVRLLVPFRQLHMVTQLLLQRRPQRRLVRRDGVAELHVV